MSILQTSNIFLDRPQPGTIRSVLLVIIGWLVSKKVLSETTLRIFMIFCMKLEDYKGRKVTQPLDLEIFAKTSPI